MKPRDLRTVTNRDVKRAVTEAEWFAALVDHPQVPDEAKEIIRCFMIAFLNQISEYLSDRSNPFPEPELVKDVYPYGRLLYPERNGLDALTTMLVRMGELGVTGTPPYIRRYALTKAQRERNEGNGGANT